MTNPIRTITMLTAAALAPAACFSGEADAPDAPEIVLADQAGAEAVKIEATAASRFLVQATFGPSEADIARLQRQGIEDWLTEQVRKPIHLNAPRIKALPDATRPTLSDLFWAKAIDGEDQLRQRVAYAVSQIVPVSMSVNEFYSRPEVFAQYMDVIQRGALGNYTDMIREVSVSPAMGLYLSSLGNERASGEGEMGVAPDENFARELMQLFTIGLEELNPDGTPKGQETYTIEDIKGLSAVFTGLSWAETRFRWPQVGEHNHTLPMQGYAEHHEPAPKSFLGAVVDEGQNPGASIDAALDHLLAHPNLGPFVGKQLIQRLVTANPSPAYVARVTAAFEAGFYGRGGWRIGTGRRGDMAATVAAILLDPEARDPAAAQNPEHGRVRDPAMRFAQYARAFRDAKTASPDGRPPEVGTLRWAHQPNVLGQRPYDPPSVFGFSRPGYVAPASRSAERDMVAPGLSLSAGTQMITYVRFMGRAVAGHNMHTDFFDADAAPFLADAARPADLVERLDTLLTYGTLQPSTATRIAEALETVTLSGPDDEDALRDRFELAVLMISTSPEYAVLR